MERRATAAILGMVVLLAFVFFAPVIPVGPLFEIPCLPHTCNWPVYGSVTYWAFGVGSVWMLQGYYTFVT